MRPFHVLLLFPLPLPHAVGLVDEHRSRVGVHWAREHAHFVVSEYVTPLVSLPLGALLDVRLPATIGWFEVWAELRGLMRDAVLEIQNSMMIPRNVVETVVANVMAMTMNFLVELKVVFDQLGPIEVVKVLLQSDVATRVHSCSMQVHGAKSDLSHRLDQVSVARQVSIGSARGDVAHHLEPVSAARGVCLVQFSSAFPPYRDMSRALPARSLC